MAYDLASRQIAISNELGYTTTTAYDVASRVASLWDANGNVISYAYDAINQRLSTVYRDGSCVTMGYDPVGNRTTMQDWGGTTTYAFDPRYAMLGAYSGESDQSSARKRSRFRLKAITVFGRVRHFELPH